MKAITQKDKKTRKLLMVVPILVLPFICMLFWALGGGFDASARDDNKQKAGLNTRLPDPNFDNEKENDKMSFYRQAARDSLELLEQIRNDPYYRATSDTLESLEAAMNDPDIRVGTYGNYKSTGDPNVDRINDRLAKLYTQVNQPQLSTGSQATPGAEIDRMQAMLETNGQTGGGDPEMAQLEGMLEKILDIQNPQRAKEKLREQSLKNRKQVYPVSTRQKNNPVSLLQANDFENSINVPSKYRRQKTSGNIKPNAFYEWSQGAGTEDEKTTAVSAVVQQTTTVVSGATLKLRLSDDIYINGTSIPKGTFVYGTCALSGDRLTITLNSIRYGNGLFPVNLIAYDMDGIAGIYMPGAISRDVAKNSAQDAVQGVDYYSMDNSLTSQATSVGVQAVKSLLSKKAKLIKVTVKAGYWVLLKDANAQD